MIKTPAVLAGVFCCGYVACFRATPQPFLKEVEEGSEMIITHKVKMDLMQREVTPRVDVVQGDVCTRVLELALFSGGKECLFPKG